MTEKEIIAQCIAFFGAGFETTSTGLAHAVYELAMNPEVQERLHAEIVELEKEYDPDNMNVHFEAILNQAPYLEAIVKETLRKYPPLVRIERRVTSDKVTLGGIPLDKDVLIEIPTIAVHRDPDYYPEPDRFNPERFMPENKHLLVPYTYLHFGDGPRNCVGMRFAYQEAKLALASMVRRYRFATTANTPDKLCFRAGQLMMNCMPFEVALTKR